MHKTIVLLTLLVLAALLVVPTLAQDAAPEPVGLRPDAPTYALHGPYWVGTRQFVIEPDSEHPLPATIWYPALNPDQAAEDITYQSSSKWDLIGLTGNLSVIGHALKDAVPDMAGAPYPLVVFSHGFATFGPIYATMLEHLASYGFVVVAPEHDEHFEPEFKDLWSSSIERPLDIQRTLTFAESLTANGGDLEGLLDVERLAVAGQSYGGYTALAAGGARYDLPSFNQRCEVAHASGDPNVWLCDPLVPHETDMAALAGLDPMPDGLWPSWGDPRVDAIISMAGDSYLFDKAGIAEITAPIMAIGGSDDTSTPADWGIYPTYEYASSAQKALVVFDNGEHMLFGVTCDAIPWITDLWYGGCADPVWDKDRAHDLINHFTTAFLLDVLKGDQDAHAALLAENVSFPGITYDTTMK